ncbi:unnamed protein product [Clonostachys chloroleuca]|uniref:Alpha-ketoglutarate-dependent sulfonate dioxygenase n=1 Tax=Clonostachys chloroleuca TaxID=1926264 RepID=A0AA35LY50_9HYPO|nr:unnamed protein product [Clonostachys chloroleuca]
MDPLGGHEKSISQAAPSSYDNANANAHPAIDISASFANLSLASGPHDPTPDSCLAHLKLLYAFQVLKEDIGYTDGLWGLWDARTQGKRGISRPDETGKAPKADKGAALNDHTAQQEALSQVREKRWAVFVARAVDRYESWWKSMSDENPLQESDMENDSSLAYDEFPSTGGNGNLWSNGQLPPLDVLMVWHSHMLNPRAYLEDCMRAGLRQLWWHGMPWTLINNAIDSNFTYSVSEDTKAMWVANTDHSWVNTEDMTQKAINCPICTEQLHVAWTTCGADEHADEATIPSLIGSGYGDGEFQYACHGCGTNLTKELLSLSKFDTDMKKLLRKGVPMPGTVLEPQSGKPKSYKSRSTEYAFEKFQDPLRLPNRLIQQVLSFQLHDLRTQSQQPGFQPPTMEGIRRTIEDTLTDSRKVDQLVARIPSSHRIGRAMLPAVAGVAIRKMMSRYWDNFSAFALDLCGAVMRQGVFVEKMYHLDWLHSPVAPQAMTRVCGKYKRFLAIMQDNPTHLCVPTLDVDLAWHTHQLSPSAYYTAVTSASEDAKFIDHDDKISDDKLGQAFEWTSKTYQQMYQEVYSECTCWYCETIRSSHISSIGKALGLSTNDTIANRFHESGAAQQCPPNNSAHISAHNAVSYKLTDPGNAEMIASKKVGDAARRAYQRRLEDKYQKACKRAGKKGRTLPPRDEYYSHWGYPYYMYGPYVYPPYYTPGLYPGYDPYSVPCEGSGCPGACASGTCGGGVASGACGGPGGCGSSTGGCSSGGGGSSSGGCGGGGGGGGGD